jgi:predicted GTPase
VIVGEFNAGKSALVNALWDKVLPRALRRPHLGSRWSSGASTPSRSSTRLRHLHLSPASVEELNIVDTPGTNAVIRRHERLTDEFVAQRR